MAVSSLNVNAKSSLTKTCNMWSAEIEAEFIEEVQQKEYLWNVKSQYYTKKTLKKCSYEEIALKLRERWPEQSALFTADLLMKKFSKLRSYYLREKRKTISYKSGSESLGFTPRWIHFTRMSFMSDVTEAEESISSLDISVPSFELEEDEVSNNEVASQLFPEDILNSSDETPVGVKNVEGNNLSQETAVAKPSRKRKRDSTDVIIREAGKLIEKLNNSDTSGDRGYAEYIEAKLNEIKDPYKKELARLDIQKVLIKYTYE